MEGEALHPLQTTPGADTIKKPSQFEQEANRLDSNLASLDGVLTTLANRLAPVMMPPVDTDKVSGEAPHPVHSNATATVWSAANRCDYLASRVRYLLEQLDI